MSAADPVVLVVEDEPRMRSFLRTSLLSQGYAPVEAAKETDAAR